MEKINGFSFKMKGKCMSTPSLHIFRIRLSDFFPHSHRFCSLSRYSYSKQVIKGVTSEEPRDPNSQGLLE